MDNETILAKRLDEERKAESCIQILSILKVTVVVGLCEQSSDFPAQFLQLEHAQNDW